MELRAEVRRARASGNWWLRDSRSSCEAAQAGGGAAASSCNPSADKAQHADDQPNSMHNFHNNINGMQRGIVIVERENPKWIQPTAGPTSSHRIVAATHSTVSCGPIIIEDEAQNEKKCRRAEKQPLVDDGMRVEYTVVYNPLAEVSSDETDDHFLSVGPGPQARREQ